LCPTYRGPNPASFGSIERISLGNKLFRKQNFPPKLGGKAERDEWVANPKAFAPRGSDRASLAVQGIHEAFSEKNQRTRRRERYFQLMAGGEAGFEVGLEGVASQRDQLVGASPSQENWM
jgi:hypothetical protein